MGDYFTTKGVKAVRKARSCSECGQMIEVGQPAENYAQVFEGDFYSGSTHPDCSTWATRAIKSQWGEGRPFLNDCDPEEDDIDHEWIEANPPPADVRARMNAAWIKYLESDQ